MKLSAQMVSRSDLVQRELQPSGETGVRSTQAEPQRHQCETCSCRFDDLTHHFLLVNSIYACSSNRLGYEHKKQFVISIGEQCPIRKTGWLHEVHVNTPKASLRSRNNTTSRNFKKSPCIWGLFEFVHNARKRKRPCSLALLMPSQVDPWNPY